MLAVSNNVELVLIIAAIVFCISGLVSTSHKSWEVALISFGLALFALAFVVNP